LDSVEKTYDAEISLLFEGAREELRKEDARSKDEKKQIITDLAKSLEEKKITTDTISVEIVNQLRGQVSERFIRECLPEKYKQKVRVDNAKKQQKGRQKERNLAAVTPLNQVIQEDEEGKEAVIIDVDGRLSL
jgi:hypothetical protein